MTTSARFCRRLSPRVFVYFAIVLTILLCIYYASYTSEYDKTPEASRREPEPVVLKHEKEHYHGKESPRVGLGTCPRLLQADADVNTVDVFQNFEFQPTWMKTKEYWDKTFDDRYERQKMDPERPPLKVIIVPHSHNDPGWLKTFENYYYYQSKQIMNNMVTKLKQYQNLTFIWSEMSFLNSWWQDSHPNKQALLRSLAQSGRLEIMTGGWVMTDEANAHVFAMVDQLIEGHQWVWSNLGVKPKAGWSVDPFGHGSTVPYLLAQSGIKGTVIQRIHYAWKQWFALKQYGDFKWVPSWATSDPSATLLTHNQPFDIYSIKHSCGPHPYICLSFDFRKVYGEFTEYSVKAQTITDKNVKEKSELLLEQYSRTGSLFPHNVVLIPLGDDFRYNVAEEWDQQYSNYIKIIDFINANKETYKAEVMFGTPTDYFNEITKRYDQFPTLKGDFFVYSDIFSEGRPAYWSGYFTSRPFMKSLDRELEHNLRSAEILYTVALNSARQNKRQQYLKILERDFEKLAAARQNLGLFQHHDAITGTSKAFVMRDYGLKLFQSVLNTVSIQQNALQSLLFPEVPLKKNHNLLLSDFERETFEKLPKKTILTMTPKNPRKIVLYNSLAQTREHIIKIRSNTSDVKVLDDKGQEIPYQISPVWTTSEGSSKYFVAANDFEIIFIATLPPLSITMFTLHHSTSTEQKLSTIFCNKCQKERHLVNEEAKTENTSYITAKFTIKSIPSSDIQLENHKFRILISGATGFLKSITRKHNPKIMQCAIQFAAYRSAQFHSGAYLFMPDPNERDIEKDVLQFYKDQMKIFIVSGPVYSELTVVYGPFLMHTITVFHHSSLANALYIENTIDFENPPKNRETELFMRIVSDVQNGDPPEFYSDLNGFQMQKRVKVERIGIEGNYFPITSMAYIQDDSVRLSLLTDHAQGASSWQPGYLELMLDRRTLYDDSRGMGEGLVDNKKTVQRHWLLIEDISRNVKEHPQPKRFENADDTFEKGDVVRSFNQPTESATETKQEIYSRPSLYAQHLSNILNYPALMYILDTSQYDPDNFSVQLFSGEFPCDTHLMNLRTQPDAQYSQFPSSSALMILHRQGYDCAVNSNYTCNVAKLSKEATFEHAKVKDMQIKSLTGLETILDKLQRISDAYVEPMALKTLNITFV